MKASSILLTGALALTGAASAVALARGAVQGNDAVIWTGDDDDHAGPDSARVEMFLGALHAADPMLCEMVADQLGNFWSSEGDYGIGGLADAARGWRQTRDSLASRVTDAAALRRLARGLDDPNPCARRVAAKMLGRSRERGAGLLRDALKSPTARVREAAALGLGHAEMAETLGDLQRATHDDDQSVVAMATWALGELERPEAIDRLGELTRSRDLRVRRAAAWALGSIEDPRGVAPLLPLLKDSDVGIRVVTASALGDIENPTAVEPLMAVLGDQEAAVRRSAVEALGNIEDNRAAPALGRALQDSDRRVRRAAAEALGNLDELGQATEEVIAALGHALADTDREMRRAAVEALSHIDGDAVTAHLLRALRDSDPEVRRAAAEALGDRKEH